jgi:hypothetical protein
MHYLIYSYQQVSWASYSLTNILFTYYHGLCKYFVAVELATSLSCYVMNMAPSAFAFSVDYFVLFMFILYGMFLGVVLASLFDYAGIASDVAGFVINIFSLMGTNRSKPMVEPLEIVNYLSPFK